MAQDPSADFFKIGGIVPGMMVVLLLIVSRWRLLISMVLMLLVSRWRLLDLMLLLW